MTRTIKSVMSTAFVLLFGVVLLAQAPTPTDKADALGEAARKGDVAAVKKLLDEGVDVNSKFRYGATSLSYACDRGHVDVVKLLLERGADVNVRDSFYNFTPLALSINPPMGRKPQHAEIVGLLLKRGATGKDNALMTSIFGPAPDAAIVKAILDSGGIGANTLSDALGVAAKGKRQEIVALLEQAGAKPAVEFKVDAAVLARYAGTYTGAGGEVVWTVVDGKLIGGPGGQKLTLVGRSETTFGIAERPGTAVEFQVKDGKVATFLLGQGGNNVTFTRVEGK